MKKRWSEDWDCTFKWISSVEAVSCKPVVSLGVSDFVKAFTDCTGIIDLTWYATPATTCLRENVADIWWFTRTFSSFLTFKPGKEETGLHLSFVDLILSTHLSLLRPHFLESPLLSVQFAYLCNEWQLSSALVYIYGHLFILMKTLWNAVNWDTVS